MQINSIDFILFVNKFCVKCTNECTHKRTQAAAVVFDLCNHRVRRVEMCQKEREERERREININDVCKMCWMGHFYEA